MKIGIQPFFASFLTFIFFNSRAALPRNKVFHPGLPLSLDMRKKIAEVGRPYLRERETEEKKHAWSHAHGCNFPQRGRGK